MSTQQKTNLPKRMKTWSSAIQAGKYYDLEAALTLVKQLATAKFDESVDVAVNLGIDASKSDQQVRGSTVMPLVRRCGSLCSPAARTKMWPGKLELTSLD